MHQFRLAGGSDSGEQGGGKGESAQCVHGGNGFDG